MIPAALRMDAWTPAPLPAPKPRAQAPRSGSRHYVAARLGSGDVLAPLQSKDAEVKRDLAAVRRNSRLLCNNNPLVRQYIRLLGNQALGAMGIAFQSRAPEAQAKKIEAAWEAWGRKGTCTACGRYSWVEVQRLFLKTTAQDGEAFIRLVPDAVNPFGLSLQFLDADLLDHTFNRAPAPGQNAIVMGVELNAWGRAEAYWFSDPASLVSLYNRGRKIRIPSTHIIHGMDPERSNQTRGMPWAAAAMFLVDMLGHYWESEVAAARHEAERQAFLISETLDLEGEAAEAGQPSIQDLASSVPGGIKYIGLPPGVKPEIPEVQHPTTAFAEFSRGMVKTIASGFGVSYADLSADLTQASWGSIRDGRRLAEDGYRVLQHTLKDILCERVFETWFDLAVLSGALQVPVRLGAERAKAHVFIPRGWPWVDPKNDAIAQDMALRNGLTSRTRILAEQGLDFRDVVEELAFEDALLKAKGVQLPGAVPTPKGEPDKEDPDAA